MVLDEESTTKVLGFTGAPLQVLLAQELPILKTLLTETRDNTAVRSTARRPQTPVAMACDRVHRRNVPRRHRAA